MSIVHLLFISVVRFYLQLDSFMYDKCYQVSVCQFGGLLIFMMIFWVDLYGRRRDVGNQGLEKISNFLIQQQQIANIISSLRYNIMAQLRTSFIQTCNNTSSVFSNWSSIAVNMNSLINNDDQEQSKNLKSQQKTVSPKACRSLLLFPSKFMFFNEQQRSVQSLINLNINSLSQLKDVESTDFPKDQNFTHVLQIQQEQDQPTNQQKYLQSLQTIQSMQIQDNFPNNFSPNSTQIGSQFVHDDILSDYSDVQPYQI